MCFVVFVGWQQCVVLSLGLILWVVLLPGLQMECSVDIVWSWFFPLHLDDWEERGRHVAAKVEIVVID